MEKIKNEFVKNGLNYSLQKRVNDYALFELSNDTRVVGYEVSKIYESRSEFISSPRETITPNSYFGYDGSKSFGLMCKALDYFLQVTQMI